MSIEPDNYPELFPYVLLVMSLISFECIIVSFVFSVPARTKAFNKEFLLQFTKTHEDAFQNLNVVSGLGFPDTGSGRYA